VGFFVRSLCACKQWVGVSAASPKPTSPRYPAADPIREQLSAALSWDSGDVDLLIRTGGEKRLSDFLLWESAYAELLFTDQMWPDFEVSDLNAALKEFWRRERRFGGSSTSSELPTERER
jgi:undecaprenyl diphosphate synthase